MAGVNKKTSKGGKLSPFDFLNSINFSKNNLIYEDPDNAKYYNSFMVNRSLSYFTDTIYAANTMNRYHHLDKDMQYDFLLHLVRSKKRFSKWEKTEDINNIDFIMEYFGYSAEKAKQVLPLLTKEQITIIANKVSKGGRT